MHGMKLAPWMAAIFIVGWQAPQCAAFNMYCPRSNLKFSQNSPALPDLTREIVLVTNAGAPMFFPRTARELRGGADDVSGIAMTLTDCSTSTFLCRRVTLNVWEEPATIFYLVMPKVIRPRQEFDFQGVHIVTRVAAITRKQSEQTFQLTLWQLIDGRSVPMELTIQEGKGMIYWDGIRLSKDDGTNEPELCVLDSEVGLFSSAKLQAH